MTCNTASRKTSSVSVIIPTYNREATVADAIISVLEQKFDGDLEVIVSDDGSSDSTIDIAKSFGEKVKIVLKPEGCKDQGAAATRNRGILAASNDYVAFLDSDDYYLDGVINRLVAELDSNAQIAYVFCRSLKRTMVNGEERIQPWTRSRMSRVDREYHVLFRAFCINTNSIMVRRWCFDEVGLFNAALTNGEDSDMWLRLSENFSGKFVDFYGNVYRLAHGGEQLSNADLEVKKYCSKLILLNAFSRAYFKGESGVRLLLIIRAMFFLFFPVPVGRLGRLFLHARSIFFLFALCPLALIIFLVQFLRA